MLKTTWRVGQGYYTLFVMSTMLLLCLEIYERDLLYSGRVLLSKHVIRYDLGSCIPNYNLPPLSKLGSLFPNWMRAMQLCDCSLWHHHHYPATGCHVAVYKQRKHTTWCKNTILSDEFPKSQARNVSGRVHVY